MRCICLGYYDKVKHEGCARASNARCSTHVLNTTTIFAPMDVLPADKHFSLRRTRTN